jgi:hypothetical protein
MAAYSVTRHGNFKGKNILEFVGDMNQRPPCLYVNLTHQALAQMQTPTGGGMVSQYPLWALANGFRHCPMPYHSPGRLPSSAIWKPPTHRPR